jgi:hypothetical protein
MMQGGVAVSQTPLALDVRLVAPPALAADGDAGLIAAWSDAVGEAEANLVVQRVE